MASAAPRTTFSSAWRLRMGWGRAERSARASHNEKTSGADCRVCCRDVRRVNRDGASVSGMDASRASVKHASRLAVSGFKAVNMKTLG